MPDLIKFSLFLCPALNRLPRRRDLFHSSGNFNFKRKEKENFQPATNFLTFKAKKREEIRNLKLGMSCQQRNRVMTSLHALPKKFIIIFFLSIYLFFSLCMIIIVGESRPFSLCAELSFGIFSAIDEAIVSIIAAAANKINDLGNIFQPLLKRPLRRVSLST